MKNKMSKSKVANRVTGLQEFLDSLSKPEMKNGGLKPVNSAKNPGLAKLPTKVRNKMGYMEKGGMSRMANEGFNNAKRTITDGYRGTGAPNPLRNIVKKNKMGMGGAFFPQNPLTMSKYQNDNLDNQYYKKGGMVKKKKKNC